MQNHEEELQTDTQHQPSPAASLIPVELNLIRSRLRFCHFVRAT